jgi:hypothetical protein
VQEKAKTKMSATGAKQIFSIGELIDFQWRLGVTVKSNNADTVGIPNVTISAKVKDTNQKISTHTFEMNLSEFQVQNSFKLT